MRRALATVLLLTLVSCSQETLDGMRLPQEVAAEKPAFFVQRHPNDKHNFDEVIADVMLGHGMRATVIEPQEYDYRVTYVDRWYWDMRTYLIDFRIDIRDAKTNVLVATARSYQTSIAALGQRSEQIVARATKVLLEGPGAVPTPASPEARKKRGRID